MKKLICLILTIGASFFIISSTCDSPIVGDHSGAPGETNCSGCHSSPVNPDLPFLHFEIESNDTAYVPGSTYVVHLSIKKPGHVKFGFVCSALDSANISKGTFNLIDSTVTRKYTLGGRKYISHTPCGADATDSISWTFNWVAPTNNAGPIKIYMSMLVANHDHALTGDTTYTRIISLMPSEASGINTTGVLQETMVYPTTFTNAITVHFNSNYRLKAKEVILVSINGRIIDRFHSKESAQTFFINSDLTNGLYLLKVNYTDHSEVFKVIKQ